jgi:hypothetical protein
LDQKEIKAAQWYTMSIFWKAISNEGTSVMSAWIHRFVRTNNVIPFAHREQLIWFSIEATFR